MRGEAWIDDMAGPRVRLGLDSPNGRLDGGVLMRLDGESYGGGLGDVIRQNFIGCKPKGEGQRCLMGGCEGSNRDLKFIGKILRWRVREN